MMKLLRSKKGQGMSEYLIILALVAIATIGAVIFFADNVRDQIASIAEEISGQDETTRPDSAMGTAARDTYDLTTFADGDEP